MERSRQPDLALLGTPSIQRALQSQAKSTYVLSHRRRKPKFKDETEDLGLDMYDKDDKLDEINKFMDESADFVFDSFRLDVDELFGWRVGFNEQQRYERIRSIARASYWCGPIDDMRDALDTAMAFEQGAFFSSGSTPHSYFKVCMDETNRMIVERGVQRQGYEFNMGLVKSSTRQRKKQFDRTISGEKDSKVFPLRSEQRESRDLANILDRPGTFQHPTEQAALFVHYTISEDRSGDYAAVCKQRLAALSSKPDISTANLAYIAARNAETSRATEHDEPIPHKSAGKRQHSNTRRLPEAYSREDGYLSDDPNLDIAGKKAFKPEVELTGPPLATTGTRPKTFRPRPRPRRNEGEQ